MSDFDPDRKPSRRLWLIAAIGALALHAGGVALALNHLQGDESDGGLGAVAGEYAVELASPRVEDSDLPPGPDTEASAASPAVQEQKAVLKDTDLPTDKVTETDEPDRVVTETDSKKPKEEETEKAAVQQTASTESVAAEATARQSFQDARESDSEKAPNVGIGKDAQRLSAEWAKQLSAYFELHKRYPEVKTAKNAKVKVNFALNRQGHVMSVSVLQSSGDTAFDEAAIAMIRRSDPVPPPPMAVRDDQLTYNIEVIFNESKKARR